MSKENVEVVRKVLEAWNSRDADTAREYLAPDIEWEPINAAVEGSAHGPDEVVEAALAIWDVWESFRFVESEVRESGDAVLWLGRVHATGGASGVTLDQEFGFAAEVRNGLLARSRAFVSWREALEASGISD